MCVDLTLPGSLIGIRIMPYRPLGQGLFSGKAVVEELVHGDSRAVCYFYTKICAIRSPAQIGFLFTHANYLGLKSDHRTFDVVN